MFLKQLMNTKIKKGILNSIIFIFFVGITFYIILKENDLKSIFEIIQNCDKRFIFISILCMICFVFSEGINIGRTLKLLNCKISFLKGIKYALVGFFFSSVTPGASGGDPMQLYYMKKDNLPIGHSALAILTEFSSFQFVTITLAVFSYLFQFKLIENLSRNVKYLLFIGILFNLFILSLILLSVFSKKLINNLVDLIYKILKKMHFKKSEEFKEKSLKQIKEYKRGEDLLLKNKKVLAKILLTTTFQIVLYHSIPYFIYLSFGLKNANYFEFLAIQSVLYISTSCIPFPGTVGVSEGGFLLIYKLLFPIGTLTSAMLLSRGISFYLFVVISGISVLTFTLLNKKSNSNLTNL